MFLLVPAQPGSPGLLQSCKTVLAVLVVACVLFWRRCDTFCTSGVFADDDICSNDDHGVRRVYFYAAMERDKNNSRNSAKASEFD